MNIDFNKNKDGLVPAIIQDAITKNVLMLGYMNQEAFDKTCETKKITFFSRTKNRLWTKGEESGNFLLVKDIQIDLQRKMLQPFLHGVPTEGRYKQPRNANKPGKPSCDQ